MRSTLITLLVLSACGVPDEGAPATSSLALIGCTNPLTCPSGPPPPPPTVDPCANVSGTLTASNLTPSFGSPVTFTWSSSGTSCRTALTLNGVTVAGSGSLVVNVDAEHYALRIGDRLLAEVVLTLGIPNPVRITANTAVQRDLLIRAAQNLNQTIVLVDDVELDFSGYNEIGLAAGVRITSERRPQQGEPFVPIRPLARDSNHLGPRIFTTTPGTLFVVNGDYVLLRGFRLEGPDQNESTLAAKGVYSNRHLGLELDGLELSGWPTAGVEVHAKNDVPWVASVDDVWVHDCFIHHNLTHGTMGYGVVVGYGGRARIEHNVFDSNRHAIASDGTIGTSYVAHENLVLKGGGQDNWGVSQQFDVHGTMDCWGYDANCGRAGLRYEITRNTFQFLDAAAFKLRGWPDDTVVIAENVFAGARQDAIDWTVWEPTVDPSNRFNRDTFGEYGVCDFDGDGLDDLFLATGKTWWFMSAGRFHWTFLASSDDALAQLGLGDFDHDGRCDVFRSSPATGWQVSKGGRAPWLSMQGANYFPREELAFHDFNGDGFTDIFRREPGSTGNWWLYTNPMQGAPALINSSNVPLADLRFGDFDADRRADVVAVVGGMRKISRGGVTQWQTTSTSSSSLSDLMVGDLDSIAGDDFVRRTDVVPGQSSRGSSAFFELSTSGRGSWSPLVSISYLTLPPGLYPAGYAKPVVLSGRFARRDKDSLITASPFARSPVVLTPPLRVFRPHGLYAW